MVTYKELLEKETEVQLLEMIASGLPVGSGTTLYASPHEMCELYSDLNVPVELLTVYKSMASGSATCQFIKPTGGQWQLYQPDNFWPERLALLELGWTDTVVHFSRSLGAKDINGKFTWLAKRREDLPVADLDVNPHLYNTGAITLVCIDAGGSWRHGNNRYVTNMVTCQRVN